jgi:hypothetical protein
MLSYQSIQSYAREAADRARAEGLTPLPVEQAVAVFGSTGRFGGLPFLGDYVPEGWVRTEIEPLFVDATGHGRDDEPALTLQAFVKELRKYAKARDHYAVGIVEAGECQVVIALYRPDPRDFTGTGKLTEKEMRLIRGK